VQLVLSFALNIVLFIIFAGSLGWARILPRYLGWHLWLLSLEVVPFQKVVDDEL
jgi:hypothetical protein